MVQGGGGILRELAAVFGIEVEGGDKLKNLDKALEHSKHGAESFRKKLREVAEVFAEALALHEVKEFFSEQIEGAAHLQDLSEKLGLTTDELERFQFAAKAAGVDSETAAHAIGLLNRNLGVAVLGKGGGKGAGLDVSADLKKLGTDAAGNVRPISDVLLDVADQMDKLESQPEKAAYAFKVFGRSGMEILPVLAQGREALLELYEEQGKLGAGLGGQFPKDAKKAREEIEHFHYAINSVKRLITATALPALTWLFEHMKRGAVAVKDFARNTTVLQTGMTALAVISAGKLLLSLKKILKVFGVLKPSILGTVGALLKFALPLAVIGLVYLAVDDLWALMRGGKSVIGDVIESFLGLEARRKFVDQLKGAWAAVNEAFRVGKGTIGGVLDLLKATIPLLIAGFGTFVVAIKTAIEGLKDLVDLIVDVATGLTTGDWTDFWRDNDKNAKGLIDDFKLMGRLLTGQLAPSGADGAPPPAAPGGPRILDLGTLPREAAGKIAATVPSSAGIAVPTTVVAGARNVQQHTEVTVNVAGAVDAPTARAIGQGTASEVDKANDRALHAVLAP